MEIKGIKFVSCVLDGSGYAKAARQNILALHKLGIPITIKQVSFEAARPDLGDDGVIIKSLINKDIDYNIIFCQLTPEWWADHKEEGKLFCGFTIWETSKLHPSWPKYINSTADVCFVGCEWNVGVFKESGVEVPIFNAPHCISIEGLGNSKPFDVKGIDKDTHVFLNIQQWTERKAPLSLIKAYWHAFQNNENVALVMKTYRSSYVESEKDAIRTTITRLKKVMPMEKYPPIYLVLDMLSEAEISGLHARANCYISLDRGEGFGLTAFASGAAGNPIIVTSFGGAVEYAKPDNSYLCNYTLTPVFGQPWSPWYRGDQLWAEPDVKHGSDLMCHVYNNQEEAKAKGQKLKKYIEDNFSLEVIGNKIIDGIRSL